jgi:uncharacterized protein (DUF1015 family)
MAGVFLERNAMIMKVILSYNINKYIDKIVRKVPERAPFYKIGIGDETHVLYKISDTEEIAAVQTKFRYDIPKAYIADGHHRSASASRISKTRVEAGETAEDAPHRHFLSVIFPHHQMKILDYNRVITDLNGLDAAELLDRVEVSFKTKHSPKPVKPKKVGEFGLYVEGNWYHLIADKDIIPKEDPVKRLDVSVLHDNAIEPFLGISDPRKDTRIDFVGGIRGLGELERRVDSGEMAVAFSFYPTSIEDLMSVADANEVMPPKSTWFEPKLADGLVSYMLKDV